MKTILPITGLLVLSLLTAAAWPQQEHADYVVLGKSINHRQSPAGNLSLLNTVFFAEIFATEGGIVRNGSLRGPGAAADGLKFPEGSIQFLAGKRAFSIDELTADYPDGTYYFDFDTPAGNVRALPATFRRDAGQTRNPGPIRLNLLQGDRPVDPLHIDPDLDLTVRWSAFEKGARDPRGIAEDMIYVIMGDCQGKETVHSGHALSDAHALTFEATEFVIHASSLSAGKTYQLEVEHSNMDTDIQQNIEVIVTYAATTFLDIRTTGDASGNDVCPELPYAMDGGQTDRPGKP
jgi:hypothetical protein